MISVCMATYNGEHFIKEQIDSILPQLSQDDELIISDDGSTDRTLEIIASYNDERIKVFHHQRNSEYSKIKHGRNFYFVTNNFENALRQAKGNYIFLSDQDDVWMPKKVSRCISLLKTYDCVIHNYSVIDKEKKLLKKSQFENVPIHKTVIMNVLDSHFRGCCMVFKSNFLKYIIPIPKKVIGYDYWIGALINHFGKLFYEMKPLILYREYDESVSSKRKRSLVYKISFRFRLFQALRKRIKEQ